MVVFFQYKLLYSLKGHQKTDKPIVIDEGKKHQSRNNQSSQPSSFHQCISMTVKGPGLHRMVLVDLPGIISVRHHHKEFMYYLQLISFILVRVEKYNTGEHCCTFLVFSIFLMPVSVLPPHRK